MQQPLPFTVLKRDGSLNKGIVYAVVATALTVYGIETQKTIRKRYRLSFWVATALTVYGIETTKE